MGFERTTAIIQGTKNLTDFSGTVSNYETDVFRPIFNEIEKLSGKKYASTLPNVSIEDSSPNWEHIFQTKDFKLGSIAADLLAVLDEREKRILFSRFGLDGGQPKTF